LTILNGEKRGGKMKNYAKIYALVLVLALVTVWAGGCASSQTGKSAKEGAVLGAVGGAVAGGVSALIFGGNVAQGAAAGAAIGAASGAATGATAGAMADNQAKQQQAKEQQVEELKKRIGDQNFEAATFLAKCNHRKAIDTAQKAESSADAQQRLYALYIQAVAAEESGDQKLASSVYSRVLQEDPSRGPEDKLKTQCLQGVMKVQKIRQENGLPPLCK
jgi:osmotically inducible lipoprotein OsmB